MCFLVLQMFFRSYDNTTNENKLQKGETQNTLMYCTVQCTSYGKLQKPIYCTVYIKEKNDKDLASCPPIHTREIYGYMVITILV